LCFDDDTSRVMGGRELIRESDVEKGLARHSEPIPSQDCPESDELQQIDAEIGRQGNGSQRPQDAHGSPRQKASESSEGLLHVRNRYHPYKQWNQNSRIREFLCPMHKARVREAPVFAEDGDLEGEWE
jgi:hypothetical protein